MRPVSFRGVPQQLCRQERGQYLARGQGIEYVGHTILREERLRTRPIAKPFLRKSPRTRYFDAIKTINKLLRVGLPPDGPAVARPLTIELNIRNKDRVDYLVT